MMLNSLPNSDERGVDFKARSEDFQEQIQVFADLVPCEGPALAAPDWTPVSTNTLTAGTSQFTDPQWTHHPTRLYRLVTRRSG